ncbi:MAG: GIY-YIG nuclease family protein [Candidatus Zambryskibacteria bacterium]|nr:GIY-YIG nuclease family protein [Candidatus Zambryskibacteria bacterium]
MHWVYIIKSVNNRYYIGASDNVTRRLNQHNSGRVKSTKSERPWQLIHTERYSTLSESRIREKQIKNWKSRQSIEKLVGLIV